jgi:hypothetical protein
MILSSGQTIPTYFWKVCPTLTRLKNYGRGQKPRNFGTNPSQASQITLPGCPVVWTDIWQTQVDQTTLFQSKTTWLGGAMLFTNPISKLIFQIHPPLCQRNLRHQKNQILLIHLKNSRLYKITTVTRTTLPSDWKGDGSLQTLFSMMRTFFVALSDCPPCSPSPQRFKPRFLLCLGGGSGGSNLNWERGSS